MEITLVRKTKQSPKAIILIWNIKEKCTEREVVYNSFAKEIMSTFTSFRVFAFHAVTRVSHPRCDRSNAVWLILKQSSGSRFVEK